MKNDVKIVTLTDNEKKLISGGLIGVEWVAGAWCVKVAGGAAVVVSGAVAGVAIAAIGGVGS